MLDLFADAEPWQEPLAPGAVILRRFALSRAAALLAGIDEVTAVSPFRHMVTPGGYTMSVAMANCGERAGLSVCSERSRYRPAVAPDARDFSVSLPRGRRGSAVS